MKILVVVKNYPNLRGGVLLMYVHSRNIMYKKHNIDVDVLSFSANENYVIDDIKVYTKENINLNRDKYEVVIFHAPNLKEHFMYLKKNEAKIKKIILFFHGHEVLRVNKVYSKPFPFLKENKLKLLCRDAYDVFKLYCWRHYIPRILHKTTLVFVSNWMYNQFLKFVRIDDELIAEKTFITYNNVSEIFEKSNYLYEDKEYDFITIRSNLDGSKYGVDILNKIARKYPYYKFLLIGKGNIFKYIDKSDNITLIQENLKHDEIIGFLNKSKYAIMPTRTDAQGVMACEMATYGIPMLVSDIEVMHEIFDEFSNVFFFNNDLEDFNLNGFIQYFERIELKKNKKYYNENTSKKEIELIYKVTGKKI